MIEEAIFSLLSNDATLKAAVVNRVYNVIAPESPVMPFITFSRVSGSKDISHKGSTDVTEALYQISIYGREVKATQLLAKAVEALFDGYSGIVSTQKIFYTRITNTVDLYDGEAQAMHVAVDVLISYRGN